MADFALALLILLENNDDGQRLAATWPNVGLEFNGTSFDEIPEDLLDRWSRVSGVYPDDVVKEGYILWENGLIGSSGYVPMEVAVYIKTVVYENVGKKSVRRR
jgi:hypothetical protein